MDGYVSIKDIRAGQKNINVVFIVLEVSHATITKENREVRTLKVADSTACMNVSIWDEPGQLLMPGDIVRLTKGYASIWRQCLTLYSGKTGDIQKIGEFCMVINEQVNMSEPNPLLSQQLGVNQSGSGPPGSNVNNSITNNGNANSISGQPGRQSLAIQSNTTTGSGVTTGSTTVKSGNGGNGGNVGSGGGSSSGGGNGGGGNGGNGGGGSSSSGSSGVSGSSVRYSSSDSTTKSAPTTKSNSRGRGSYRNGGRNDRR